MFDESDVFLTEKDLAKLTRTGLQTWRNRRTLGTGPPYYKLGRSVRYKLSDVNMYLDNSKIDHKKRK